MKLKNGYILREVAGSTVVVSIDPTSTFQNMLRLNGSGKFLWEKLSVGATHDELVAALLEEYEIDAETASRDTDAFLDMLRGFDAVEE